MSPERHTDEELSPDEAVRALIVLTPRMGARLKRIRVPDQLRSFNLAPRHLSLLAYLLFDGPMLVNELATRLEVAPTTVSLMVSDLSRQGVLQRHADPEDGRRTIVAITDDPETRSAIDSWLANGAHAWRRALETLSPAERGLFVRTMRAYDEASAEADEAGGSASP